MAEISVLYWNGGLTDLDRIVELTKNPPFKESVPDYLILHDPIADKNLIEDNKERQDFRDIKQRLAALCATADSPSQVCSIVELLSAKSETELGTGTVADLDVYQHYIEQQEATSLAHYHTLAETLRKLSPATHPLIVPGRNDTIALVDSEALDAKGAFMMRNGKRTLLSDIVLNLDAAKLGDLTVLGFPALYTANSDIARELTFRPVAQSNEATPQEALLVKNPGAEIVIADAVPDYNDAELNPTHGANRLAFLMKDYVNGNWSIDGSIMKKHKVIITPAETQEFQSAWTDVISSTWQDKGKKNHYSGILNAGETRAQGKNAYFIRLNERGVMKVHAVGVNGRRGTVVTSAPIGELDKVTAVTDHGTKMMQEGLASMLDEEKRRIDAPAPAELAEVSMHAAPAPVAVPEGAVAVYRRQEIREEIVVMKKPAVNVNYITPDTALQSPKKTARKAPRKPRARAKPQPREIPDAPVFGSSPLEQSIAGVWKSHEARWQKMNESRQYAMLDIAESYVPSGKEVERAQSVLDTVEGNALLLTGEMRSYAKETLDVYVATLERKGFAKKQPALFKKLVAAAKDLNKVYVKGLERQNRALHKDIGAEQKQRDAYIKHQQAALALCERADKQYDKTQFDKAIPLYINAYAGLKKNLPQYPAFEPLVDGTLASIADNVWKAYYAVGRQDNNKEAFKTALQWYDHGMHNANTYRKDMKAELKSPVRAAVAAEVEIAEVPMHRAM